MSEPRQPIGRVNSYWDILAIMRAQVATLNINYSTLDRLAGYTDTYSTKTLAPVPQKNFSPQSLTDYLDALCIDLVAFHNPEKAQNLKAKLSEKWSDRKYRPRRPSMHSDTVHIRIGHRKLKKAQRKGGANSRKFLGKRMAKRLARKAARARWHKPKLSEVKGSDAVTLRADVAAPCEAQRSGGKPGTP